MEGAATSSTPKARIDLTDAFNVERGNDGQIRLSYGSTGTHGLTVEVNDGVLSLDVKASQDATVRATKGSGTDMVASAMQRLAQEGVEVNSVEAYWLHPTLAGEGNTVNWSEFMANRANGLSLEDSARATWTGRFFGNYGFTNPQQFVLGNNAVELTFGR